MLNKIRKKNLCSGFLVVLIELFFFLFILFYFFTDFRVFCKIHNMKTQAQFYFYSI